VPDLTIRDDEAGMRAALDAAAAAHRRTSPNPRVGAVVVVDGRMVGSGATQPPGGAHAERVALAEAGPAAAGATLYTTLEPCDHEGRTAPCTDAIIGAGVARVVVGIGDPDPEVSGRGIGRLREAGLDVDVGVLEDEVSDTLAPYLHHRRTGRPYVVLKLAATLDGRIAAPDGTSRWITGSEARLDVHRLRASCDAICVGAGTIRADDPRLDVRDADGEVEGGDPPRRVVLGEIPAGARVLPADEYHGGLEGLLDGLGADGVLKLLVEGGADVAGRFHRAGLVDRYVVYLAPALLGGEDGRPLMAGSGAPTMADLRRGRFVAVEVLGDDLRLDLVLGDR
jgi:diaminohydroxyphosphoribosylaminopyrimidine deaminase/5-amino-6-(5-phosphoribosylamino)uracil reductase